MRVDRRFSLLGILGGLMVSKNLGDVHDEINHMCDLLGLERPEGSFHEGFSGPTVDLIRNADSEEY